MMKQTAKYLFLDLETTGLNPGIHEILECAAFAVDSKLRFVDALRDGSGLPELYINMVVRPPTGSIVFEDETVERMHTESGLLADVQRSTCDIHRQLTPALQSLIGAYDWSERKPILAGASVHFDHEFIAMHMLDVDQLLHHRHYDVTTLKMEIEDIMGTRPEVKRNGKTMHRAMHDIRDTLAEAQMIRKMITTWNRTHTKVYDDWHDP